MVLEQTQAKILDVAVGLIMRGQSVLISWRHAGLHQGDRHEFPGGKIEAHETPKEGLIRELKEELGIQVNQAVQAQRLVYHYPERTVRLHVFKVTDFDGEPVGQEGQHTQWVKVKELSNYKFPDANAPILRAAQLPDHYVITYEQSVDQSLTAWIDFHIEHLPEQAWVYVRHYGISSAKYFEVIDSLRQHRPDLQLVVMAQHIVSLHSLSHEIAGIHIGRDKQPIDWTDIPKQLLRFASCHDQAQLDAAMQLDVDAVTLGPVLATPTHPNSAFMGWNNWQQLCSYSSMPVYALGGVGPNDLPHVQQVGGFGVAGIRAFYSSSTD